VIDRFEGDFAVCERDDRTMVNIARGKLPAGAKEGDVLAVAGDQLTIDHQATEERRRESERLASDFWKGR
jgi:hypothetical protein